MTNSNIQELIGSFEKSLTDGQKQSCEVKKRLNDIITWLCDNDTSDSCKMVDSAVFSITANNDLSWFPNQIREIIEDMGGILHDTHEHPEIASNFLSTPPQLLERIKKVMEKE